jgi:RNA polymerase sigma-70 factor (ECF subfamily)
MEDEELIARIAAGDSVAMTELHLRWFPQFAKLATRLTGDCHAGEDIAQEVMVRVIMKASSYERGRKAKTWLTTIVYHLSRDWLRRRGVRLAVSLSGTAEDDGERAIEVPGREPTAEELALAREREDAVRTALTQLTEPEREVILLRDYRGLSAPETAELLGISIETVGGRLFRARRHLGALLQTGWPGLFPTYEL